MHTLPRALAVTLVSGLLTVGTATTASAGCPAPNDKTSYWKITNVSKSYKPTGLYSNWVHPKYAPATITYSKSATSQWTGTVSGTISAEAGVVFAKASTSITVSVAKTWSKTQTWQYSMGVPKDPGHQYQMRQRQETRKFTAKKFIWHPGNCNYYLAKQGTGEMPRTSTTSLVWDLRKRNA